jgi:excisionase family DNA binding protein
MTRLLLLLLLRLFSLTGVTTLDDLRGRATCRVEEAAEVLGISRGTAYQAARTGQLPVLSLGRRVLVSVPRLLTMLGANESPNP